MRPAKKLFIYFSLVTILLPSNYTIMNGLYQICRTLILFLLKFIFVEKGSSDVPLGYCASPHAALIAI